MGNAYPCFVHKKALTKDRFVRDTLIRLYSAGDALEFIDGVELTEPQSSTSQFLLNYGFYDVEYSCEIGYDRDEQYITEEEYYDKDLQKHLKRPVVKTRTVTDWRPHNACEKGIPGNAVEYMCNDAVHEGADPILFLSCCPSFSDFRSDDLDVDEDGNIAFETPESSDLKSAHDTCERMAVSYVKSDRLPGDKQRNFTEQAVTTAEEHRIVVAVNHWRCSFELGGETHHATQYANTPHPSIRCSYKKSDDMISELAQAQKDEIASNEEIQKLSKIGKYCSFGFIGGLLGACALGSVASGLAIFLGIAAFAALGVSFFLKKKVDAIEDAIKEKYDAMRADYKQTVCNRKIELLNARLAMMGQPALNETELAMFDPETERQLTTSF